MILYVVFLILGYMLGTVGVVVPMLIFRVHIPATQRLQAAKLLTDYKAIMRRHEVGFTFWLIIDLIAAALVAFFLPDNLLFLAIGMAVAAALGYRKTGPDREENIRNFVESCKPFLAPKATEEKVRKALKKMQ